MKFYVDVDDVLADFKGGAVLRGAKRWEGAFYANHPSTWSDEERGHVEFCNALVADESFWLSLPVNEGAFQILAACALRAETHLLTAYPFNAPVDKDMVRRAKLQWIMSQLHVPKHRVIICEREEKVRYATSPRMAQSSASQSIIDHANVLIDDAEKNVEEWRAAGGVAIHHAHGEWEATLRQIRML